MNLEQSTSIVDFVAAADNRTVSEDTYAAWHLLIGHLDYETAVQAARMALTDDNVRWVEPKSILAKVSRLIDLRDQEQRRNRAIAGPVPARKTPAPVCRAHSVSMMKCEPCSKLAAESAKRHGVESKAYVNEFYATIARSADETEETF
jgi:hypothetical protein